MELPFTGILGPSKPMKPEKDAPLFPPILSMDLAPGPDIEGFA
jgi:hypothetical protein